MASIDDLDQEIEAVKAEMKQVRQDRAQTLETLKKTIKRWDLCTVRCRRRRSPAIQPYLDVFSAEESIYIQRKQALFCRTLHEMATQQDLLEHRVRDIKHAEKKYNSAISLFVTQASGRMSSLYVKMEGCSESVEELHRKAQGYLDLQNDVIEAHKKLDKFRTKTMKNERLGDSLTLCDLDSASLGSSKPNHQSFSDSKLGLVVNNVGGRLRNLFNRSRSSIDEKSLNLSSVGENLFEAAPPAVMRA